MVRDYREIQVSSSALVLIIMGIIILGAAIFFIGVQVGKKQADLMLKSMISQRTEDKVSAQVPVLIDEEKTATENEELAEAKPESQTQTKPASSTSLDTTVPSTSPPVKTPAVSTQAAPSPQTSVGNYFIQVGAFSDRSSARLEAERFKKQGYNALVKEPFPRDRRPIYRVWLGGFNTRAEAQKKLDELISQSVRNPGYFIVSQ
jgi:cell division septation protein DedD